MNNENILPPMYNPDMGTYQIRVKCSNCNEKNTVKISKGNPVSTTPCPYCGCELLEKLFNR